VAEFSVAVLTLTACVFCTSASAKLRSRRAYAAFRAGLQETGLLPERFRPAASAALSATEAAIAICLAAATVLSATGRPRAPLAAEAALTASAVLTAVLAVGVAVVIRHGTRARCACFGTGSARPLGAVHLVRNLALLATIGAGLATSPLGHGRPSPAAVTVAAGAGVVAALLFVRWEDLADLVAPVSSGPVSRRIQLCGVSASP
jgi:hypothetical protein